MSRLAPITLLTLLLGGPVCAQAPAPDSFPAPDWSEPSSTSTYLRRRIPDSQLNRFKTVARTGSPSTRLVAVRQLGQLGYQARHVIDTLTTVLKEDTELTIRAAACEALGKIGGLAYKAIPPLCRALKDTAPRVRTYAAWALFRVRRRATTAVPELRSALLQERDPRVRAGLLHALGAYRFQARSAVSAITTCLTDTDTKVRAAACTALGWLGQPGKAAVPLLKRIFNDPKDPARAAAATALGRLGEIELLIPALNDPKLQSAVSAGLMGHEVGRSAVRLVTHAFSSTRVRAANTLGNLGERGAIAVPALIYALEKDSARPVRRAAAAALGQIGPKAAAAVRALVLVLRFERAKLKVAAAEALGRIGPQAAPAARFLGEGLDQVDEGHQLVVAKALKGLGPGGVAALPRLIDGLQWGNDKVRRACAEALGAVGDKATPAVPTLIEALQRDVSAAVRSEAAAALGAIGTSARSALPALLKAAGGDEDPVVARIAKRAAKQVQGK